MTHKNDHAVLQAADAKTARHYFLNGDGVGLLSHAVGPRGSLPRTGGYG